MNVSQRMGAYLVMKTPPADRTASWYSPSPKWAQAVDWSHRGIRGLFGFSAMTVVSSSRDSAARPRNALIRATAATRAGGEYAGYQEE